MQPMFIAHGPNIKVNYEIEPFETVDIYALLCYLLAIEPMPGVHASLDRVFDMIKTVDGQSMGKKRRTTANTFASPSFS